MRSETEMQSHLLAPKCSKYDYIVIIHINARRELYTCNGKVDACGS